MKLITISGHAGTGKTTRANKLFKKLKAEGHHVLLFDEGSLQQNTHPARHPNNADFKIECKQTKGQLKETTA